MDSVRSPIISCPHCGSALVGVGGNGVPRSLECSCGYIWCLDKGPVIELKQEDGRRRQSYITEAEFNRIKGLQGEGLSQKKIASIVGRSSASVFKVLKMEEYTPPFNYMRDVMGITDEKRARILELFAEDKHTQKEISEMIGVAQSTVSLTVRAHRTGVVA